MKLLHVDSSILGPGSVSRTLTAEIVAAQRSRVPDLEVTYRDLAADPLPHLSGLHLAASQPGAAEQSAEIQQDLERGQEALEEFLAADIVVIGAPMYNFTVSSQLKAWIDRLSVAGKTFRYGEKGVEGLAGGKKVIVASTRGGLYGINSPMASFDHQETYLRIVFAFYGIENIEFVRAEGYAMNPDRRESAIQSAREQISG